MVMENNNKPALAFMEEREKLLIHIGENLEPQPDCCIYRIPKYLREINIKAYTPQVISIGPLHHRRREFVNMEKQKIRFKREFSERIGKVKWEKLITYAEAHEQVVRNYYEDTHEFGKNKFITMILYDAVFIIELFLRFNERKSDFLLEHQIRTSISRDLQLLENQLPYIFIKALYKLAILDDIFPAQSYPSFFSLSCEFFRYCYMFNHEPDEEVEFKHFTDLRRHVITKKYHKPNSRGEPTEVPSAVKLDQSGLKFKGDEGRCLLDVRLEKTKKLGIPWFQVHELIIPRIEIYDDTEWLIRNMMALEQCHYPDETLVCNYIDLMDSLVNTVEDVDILTQAGIISSKVGDNAGVAQMFNKLCSQITPSCSCYHEIAKELNDYHGNDWNRARATLRRVYFSNPWRGTATVAAIVLLVLTLIQTIFSILQVVL